MIRRWLRNFMIGRYGPDHLYTFILIVSMIIMLISSVSGWYWLSYVGYALLIIALFRFCSRNIEKRRRENDKFIKIWWPIKTKVTALFKRQKDKKYHRYYKCPGCTNLLRVPKGKGKIQITCPKCGERFIKKT